MGIAALLALTLLAAPRGEERPPAASVGMPLWFRELVLPGGELRVADVTPDTPLVVRIASVSPHGKALRYDIEVYGLEPGDYDLRQFLERVDGSSTDDLPPIPVRITSVLPAGRVRPNELPPLSPPAVGGYRLVLIAAAVLWLSAAALFLRARLRRRRDEEAGTEAPPTLADRLRPLVERAMGGRLEPRERARLELALIAYWRERLGLDAEVSGAEAMARLRADDRAGPLLRRLEEWLHRPGGAAEEVDLAELLAPYRSPSAGAARAEALLAGGGEERT